MYFKYDNQSFKPNDRAALKNACITDNNHVF